MTKALKLDDVIAERFSVKSSWYKLGEHKIIGSTENGHKCQVASTLFGVVR